MDYEPIDLMDKRLTVGRHVRHMLNVCSTMFEIEGLPDSIPERIVKRDLQTVGYTAFIDPKLTDGIPRATPGPLGGEPDFDREPTVLIVSNPRLKQSLECRIGEDAILVRHDPVMEGLIPIILPYATLLAENELSMRSAIVATRMQRTVSAPDERTYQEAERYLRDIEDGKLSAIEENGFFEGVKIMDAPAGSQTLTGIIETEQYLRGCLFNDLCLDMNFNMKREAINTAESLMNDDGLVAYVDTVLNSLKDGFAAVNERFGYNISVKLGSAWADRRKRINGGDLNDDTEPVRPAPES